MLRELDFILRLSLLVSPLLQFIVYDHERDRDMDSSLILPPYMKLVAGEYLFSYTTLPF